MSTENKYSLITGTQVNNLPVSDVPTGDDSAIMANMPEFSQDLGFPTSNNNTLVTIGAIVTAMSFIGLVSSFTMGGLLHIIFIIAMTATFSQAIKAERI